jgi:hypothetical protein
VAYLPPGALKTPLTVLAFRRLERQKPYIMIHEDTKSETPNK